MKTLKLTLLILVAGAASADASIDEAQLHQNVHDIRIAIERSEAEARAKAQNSTIGLFLNSEEMSSIPQMRRDMAESYRQMVEVRPPCMGAEVEVNEGQAILICGDNNGLVENENFESKDTYNIDDSININETIKINESIKIEEVTVQ